MKFLFDFFPVLLFYIVFNVGKKYTDEVEAMIMATGVLMLATVIQIGFTWLKHRKIENMHVIVLVLALLFGGATIYFRDEQFLVWKVSIANWLFAAVLLGSHFIGHTHLIKRMMQKQITLPDAVWDRVSYQWIVFFTAVGFLNLYIYNALDNFDAWVDFKLFGLLGLTFVNAVVTSIYLSRHIKEEDVNDVKQANAEEG